MIKYTQEEVKKATLEYFKGDQLAVDVWVKKYALKDKEGNIYELTPDDMHKRLAKEFSRIEQKYLNPISEEEIYHLLKEFKYVVPGGSQLSGIGNNFTFTSLSNCFVIDSAVDSYGGIMKTDQEQVQIMKRRGGVGHDLSNLRPSGALANNSVLKGMAGSTLYMDRFSNSTREVSQGDRRGALMLSIDVRHPDTDKFVDAKLESGKVTGANISVKITDEFMRDLRRNKTFWQTFPVDFKIPLGIEYDKIIRQDLVNNKLYQLPNNSYLKQIDSKILWDKIIKNAHKSAEPGVLFWDTILRESPAGCYGKGWEEKSTNPCGEIPLCPYDSCRLTAINLYSYVIEPFTQRARFNFPLFRKHVNQVQRIMDDLIDLEIEKIEKIIEKVKSDPEPEDIKKVELDLWLSIKEKAKQGRRTGLGITAEGDMLAALGLKYGSDEATEFSIEVHKVMAVESYKSSIEMAKERGSFLIWDYEKEKDNVFIDRVIKSGHLTPSLLKDYMEYGRRNIANLTIAPTGSLSILTQTTSGVEPLFAPFYKRRRKTADSKVDFIDENGDKWEEYFVFHQKFVEWWRINVDVGGETLSFNEAEILLKEILKSDQGDIEMFFRDSPYYQATANDVDWKESVKMQGGIQKWVDHSISKTINLPKGTTIETVDELYRYAYEVGCKGITCYVDGSRDGVLITEEKDKKEEINKFEYSRAFKRPQSIECDIYHKTALKRNWMVLVGLVNNNPYEVFVLNDQENHIFLKKIEKGILTKVKSRTYKLEGVFQGKTYIINNIISLMSDDEKVDTRKYSSMLRHGMHPRFIVEQIREYASISSFDKVVERTLQSYIKKEDQRKEKCPECGSDNYHAESGCYLCSDCGYSKCG